MTSSKPRRGGQNSVAFVEALAPRRCRPGVGSVGVALHHRAACDRDATEVFREASRDAVAVGDGMAAELEGIVCAGLLLLLALRQRYSGGQREQGQGGRKGERKV